MEIEEHLSSGSPLRPRRGPPFQRMSELRMTGPSAEEYGEDEGAEGEEVQESLHMLHHWTYPLVTSLAHSPGLQTGAISPIISPCGPV